MLSDDTGYHVRSSAKHSPWVEWGAGLPCKAISSREVLRIYIHQSHQADEEEANHGSSIQKLKVTCSRCQTLSDTWKTAHAQGNWALNGHSRFLFIKGLETRTDESLDAPADKDQAIRNPVFCRAYLTLHKEKFSAPGHWYPDNKNPSRNGILCDRITKGTLVQINIPLKKCHPDNTVIFVVGTLILFLVCTNADLYF